MKKDKESKKFKKDKSEKGFKNWWNDSALPFMSKIGSQRHLSAIRDSFGTMIPLIIAGGIGMLIDAIIFGGAGSGKVSLLGLICKAAGNSWDQVDYLLGNATTSWGKASQIGALAFGQIQIATIGAMSLYFVFLLGYFLSLSKNYKQPAIAGLAAFASFIIAIMGQITFFMSAVGLFTALFVGIVATELFVWFGNMKRLIIKLPEGVPPAVGKSFQVFLPMIFTLTIIAVVNIFFLAPAIALPNSPLSVETWNTAISKYNVWDPKYSGDVSLEKFSAWMLKTYDLQVTTGTGITLAPGSDWNKVFGDSQTISSVEGLFNNYGISNQISMQDWFKAFDPSQSGAMTNNGFNTLGQYLLHLEGVDIAGNKGYDSLATDFIFSNIGGKDFLTVSVRYVTVSVPPSSYGLGAAIYQFFTSWFITFATGNGGLGLAVMYVFFISFFWFFGVHGSNLMAAIFEPIWWMIMGINTALVSAGLSARTNQNDQIGVFGKPFFDMYMNIGGSGATLGLIIMTLILSRRRELKEVSKYALPAGIFNINEPVIFGYPLVLNTTYIIPFILSPMAAMLVGYVATGPLHLVNVVYVTTPWTTPWLLAAVLGTVDPIAIPVALVCFIVSTAIWVPFIFLDNWLHFRKLKKTDPEAYEEEMRYIKDKEYRSKVKEENKKARKEAKEAAKKAKEELKNNKNKENKKVIEKEEINEDNVEE